MGEVTPGHPIAFLASLWLRELAAEFVRQGLKSHLLHPQRKVTALLMELWPITKETGCRT